MDFIKERIEKRKVADAYRQLRDCNHLVDFSSNNYLGLELFIKPDHKPQPGIHRAGSRLLTGHSSFKDEVEQYIADFHGFEKALIYPSGYMANLGLISCLPQRNDTIIYDEKVHASIRDGIRLSYAQSFSFRHNDIDHLERRLETAKGNCFVVVESLYSMDGDQIDLQALITLKETYGFFFIIDEAHSTGIMGEGRGLTYTLKAQLKVDALIITFGKAMGYHGAAVLGSEVLRNFQINFSRSFIYTTAPGDTFFSDILDRYKLLGAKFNELSDVLNDLKIYLKQGLETKDISYVGGKGCIFAIPMEGNQTVKKRAEYIQSQGLDVRPILSPTVKKGEERLRICLHAYNTRSEIDQLIKALSDKL